MKDLLIQLCHYPFDPLKRDNLKELLNQVQDWSKTVNLINDHGIIALAAYNIKEAGLQNLFPEEAWRILENGYRQSVVRNLWLTERWKEVNSILNAAGIKHILLKGMALEHTLYGSKGLRQMNDNDILIKKEESLRAWQILQENGFIIKPPKSSLHYKILLETGKHLPTLVKEGYSVEIHTRLFETRNENSKVIDIIFKEAILINIENVNAYIPPFEIHLKYLKQHFERHAIEGESQFRLYADIILSDKSISREFPDRFVSNPFLSNELDFRKARYRENIRSIQPKYRLRYILGDLFPSVQWMKERHGCGGFRVLLFYPRRLGKLWWLF